MSASRIAAVTLSTAAAEAEVPSSAQLRPPNAIIDAPAVAVA